MSAGKDAAPHFGERSGHPERVPSGRISSGRWFGAEDQHRLTVEREKVRCPHAAAESAAPPRAIPSRCGAPRGPRRYAETPGAGTRSCPEAKAEGLLLVARTRTAEAKLALRKPSRQVRRTAMSHYGSPPEVELVPTRRLKPNRGLLAKVAFERESRSRFLAWRDTRVCSESRDGRDGQRAVALEPDEAVLASGPRSDRPRAPVEMKPRGAAGRSSPDRQRANRAQRWRLLRSEGRRRQM